MKSLGITSILTRKFQPVHPPAADPPAQAEILKSQLTTIFTIQNDCRADF